MSDVDWLRNTRAQARDEVACPRCGAVAVNDCLDAEGRVLPLGQLHAERLALAADGAIWRRVRDAVEAGRSATQICSIAGRRVALVLQRDDGKWWAFFPELGIDLVRELEEAAWGALYMAVGADRVVLLAPGDVEPVEPVPMAIDVQAATFTLVGQRIENHACTEALRGCDLPLRHDGPCRDREGVALLIHEPDR